MESDGINAYRHQLLRLFKLDREFVAARGDWLYGRDGVPVYDALAQYGTQIFGHNDAELIASAAQYLQGNNTNFIQPHFSRSTRELARKLTQAIGGRLEHVCFTNSGAESVEAAIKLARIKTGKVKVVSLRDSFHGKTYSALSAGGSQRYKLPGIYDAVNFIAVEPDNIAELERVLEGEEVAAFIFEPIQGEGGMCEVAPAYLREAIALCRTFGVVVIADEIQCGLGRCGSLTYSEAMGYAIDVLLLGKGIGGGLVPLGAMLYSKRVYSKAFEKEHSSTFAGGGFAASIALTVLDRLTRDRQVLDGVRQLSLGIDQAAAELEADLGERVQITGVGLMRGISLSPGNGAGNYFSVFIQNSGLSSYLICSYLLHRYSILTMPLTSRPSAVRFEPALTTGAAHVLRFFEAMRDIAKLLADGRYDVLMAHLIDVDGAALLEKPGPIPIENTDAPILEPIATASEDYRNFDFAFLIHPTSETDFVRFLPRALHVMFSAAEQRRMARLLIQAGDVDPSPDVALAFRFEAAGESRKGLMIMCPLAPQAMMRLAPREKTRLIEEYFDRARELGVKVVGLGAYTSVITRGGLDIADRYPDMCITTGNGLTALTVHEQFLSVYRHRAENVTAIIGARGSVGRSVTLLLLTEVPQILLVGKTNTSVASYREFLEELIAHIRSYDGPMRADSVMARVKRAIGRNDRGSDCVGLVCSELPDASTPLVVSSDAEACLRRADYVISSTSEGKPFLDDRYLKESAVALDAGRPFDFNVSAGAKAKIFEAGLVTQPHDRLYGDCNLVRAGPGINLACLSETILLSLAGARRNYCIGRSLSTTDLTEIKQLARRYGFTPRLIEHALTEAPDDEDTDPATAPLRVAV
jgi:acetylornithine/succinyldiaminopimelate/putrescine aminotransferase/predicted amino acid dehydrogenase